jgi:hypothetical protein
MASLIKKNIENYQSLAIWWAEFLFLLLPLALCLPALSKQPA